MSKKKSISYFLFFLIIEISLSFFSQKLFAEKNTITVAAKKINKTDEIKRRPESTEVIIIDDKKKSSSNLSELLKKQTGIDIKNYGNSSVISIRGTNPEHVIICIDGIPINNSKNGEVDLNEIPLEIISRIEIYKGNVPASFGISAIGGVINIVTKKSSKGIHKIAISYGSYNSYNATLFSSKKTKKFHYTALFNANGSDGNYDFTDNNGTPVINTTDDKIVKRENNYLRYFSLNLKGGYKFKKLSVNAGNNFFYKIKGLAGINRNSIKQANIETISDGVYVKFFPKSFFKKKLKNSSHLYYNFREDNLLDPLNEINFDYTSSKGFSNTVGFMNLTELTLPKIFQTFRFNINIKEELYQKNDSSGLTETTSPLQSRFNMLSILEDELSILNDKLIITAAVKYSFDDDNFTKNFNSVFNSNNERTNKRYNFFLGSGGIKYFPYKKKSASISLFSNASYNIRMPGFTELFGDRGIIIGNTELSPENSINLNLGLSVNFLRFKNFFNYIKFNDSFFYNKLNNLITFIYNSQWTMKAQNISSGMILGNELGLSLGFLKFFETGINYTYQYAIDTGEIPYYTNNFLPHRPMHKISFSFKISTKYFAVSYSLNYTGAVFRDRINSAFYYIPQKSIHDLEIKIFPIKKLILSFKIKNIGDNLTTDIIGYPLPGRSFYGSISYKI